MKADLTGKVSLVTGAARGIGRAIADRLAANGSRVVYTDLEEQVAEAVRGGPDRGAADRSAADRVMWLPMDVTRPDQIAAAIRPRW